MDYESILRGGGMKDSEKLDDGLVISSVGNSGLIVPGHTE